MTTMLIDHVGLHLLGNDIIFRAIGRIAFPVYAFLLADGFMHVKDNKRHVGKRFLIMFALMVVSEFAYDFARCGLGTSIYMSKQSVMVSLFLGYTGMFITESLLPEGSEGRYTYMNVLAVAIISSLLCAAAYLMKADYGFAGPFFVLAFYWYIRIFSAGEKNAAKKFIFLYGLIAFYLAYRYGISMGTGNGSSQASPLAGLAFSSGYLYVPFVITSYSGERGMHTRAFNRLYTAFYPAHLLVIGLLKLLL